MSVSDGQLANQETFNNAFMSKVTDSQTTGVMGLNNTAEADSGDPIVNTQRAINELMDAAGVGGEGDDDRKNYTSNNRVADGDSRKTAIEKLDGAFHPTTGHTHDGVDSPPLATAFVEHDVTNGQSATNLSGETADGTVYTSVMFNYEIKRGTTVIANGQFAIQYLNGTWRVLMGQEIGTEVTGVTFSVTQATTVAQLQAALDSGAGDGTIKLNRINVPV